MDLSALLTRKPPLPWCEDSKLPWSDPAFSSRMLHEHLSQEHGRASRQLHVIDRHVDWIHSTLLSSDPARVLDLGCGPGLYTARLAKLGHTCVGIDFSPAAIQHARAQADWERLSCEYRLQDLREGHFGTGFDAALLLFGEFNTFSPAEARALLAAARDALGPAGSLILEAHTEASVRQIGEQPPTWFSAQQGLFSEEPHLALRECTWHAAARAAVERYFVIDLATTSLKVYTSTTQAWSAAEYDTMLRTAGFLRSEQHLSLHGSPALEPSDFLVHVAWKEPGSPPTPPPSPARDNPS